eukprot:21121-Heterococcus_DN1.PRE.1
MLRAVMNAIALGSTRLAVTASMFAQQLHSEIGVHPGASCATVDRTALIVTVVAAPQQYDSSQAR